MAPDLPLFIVGSRATNSRDLTTYAASDLIVSDFARAVDLWRDEVYECGQGCAFIVEIDGHRALWHTEQCARDLMEEIAASGDNPPPLLVEMLDEFDAPPSRLEAAE
jgi:hypothetical protein